MALRLPIVVSGRAEDGAAWSEPTETDDISTLGALFQEIGVLVTLNEIATAVGFLAPPAAMLLSLTRERWAHLKEAVIDLLSSVGGIHATDLDEVMRALRDNL